MSGWVGIFKCYTQLCPWYLEQGQAHESTNTHVAKNECNTNIFPSELMDENKVSMRDTE